MKCVELPMGNSIRHICLALKVLRLTVCEPATFYNPFNLKGDKMVKPKFQIGSILSRFIRFIEILKIYVQKNGKRGLAAIRLNICKYGWLKLLQAVKLVIEIIKTVVTLLFCKYQPMAMVEIHILNLRGSIRTNEKIRNAQYQGRKASL